MSILVSMSILTPKTPYIVTALLMCTVRLLGEFPHPVLTRI